MVMFPKCAWTASHMIAVRTIADKPSLNKALNDKIIPGHAKSIVLFTHFTRAEIGRRVISVILPAQIRSEANTDVPA